MQSSEQLLYYEKPYAGKLHVRFCEGCMPVMDISTRYMILMYYDKQYLQYCLKCIKIELRKIGLETNRKTRIYSSTDNMCFIGVKKNGRLVNYHKTVKKVNKGLQQYYDGDIELSSLISSLNYLRR